MFYRAAHANLPSMSVPRKVAAAQTGSKPLCTQSLINSDKDIGVLEPPEAEGLVVEPTTVIELRPPRLKNNQKLKYR